MKKIIIDKNKCIGCFECMYTCYDIFEEDSDGKAKVRSDITEWDIEDAEKAVINCPADAIRIVNVKKDVESTKGVIFSLLDIVGSILDWSDNDNDEDNDD